MSSHRTDPQLMPQVEERVGPGRRLSDTRQAANLSVSEVASRLHLDIDTVRALEGDDYNRLPVPTFVRGYLRGYARLLDLPPGPILEAFDQRGLAPPALVADIADKAQARATDFPMRIGTYLIVTGLVLLVVLWWHSQRDLPPLASPPLSASSGPVSEDTGAIAPEDDAVYPSSDIATADPSFVAPRTEPAPTEPAASPSTPEAVAAPSAVDYAPMIDLERASAPTPVRDIGEGLSLAVSPRLPPVEPTPSDPASAGAAAQVDPDVQPSPATLKIEPNLAAAPASTPPGETSPLDPAADPRATTAATTSTIGGAAPPVGIGDRGDRLVMQFADESWVEVYDRYDQRLAYRLARAGGEIDVRGAGPMRVLLGNAGGVSIEYNGRPHQVASRVDSGVARFVVGASNGDTDTSARPGAGTGVSNQ